MKSSPVRRHREDPSHFRGTSYPLTAFFDYGKSSRAVCFNKGPRRDYMDHCISNHMLADDEEENYQDEEEENYVPSALGLLLGRER